MGIAKHTGESYGKSTRMMHNDLKDILQDYRLFREGKRTGFSDHSFVCKASDLQGYYDIEAKRFNNRLDPKFYSPRRKSIQPPFRRPVFPR